MERLYNPDLMSETEIKRTFVARQPVVDELLGLVRTQGQGAGVQHAVIVAPRGMGKTTILLMVQFGLTDTGLAEEWQAIRFPEESYAVNDLADFWLETIRNLAVTVDEPALTEKADMLLDRFAETKDLQEAAYAVLVQWSKTHKKRLLLLVDNFDQILEQIDSDVDNASMRKVLMNEGTIMLIGGATTFFYEANAYEQPLYNFFKITNLQELNFDGVQDLLRRRADADGEENFEATLQANKGRLRVLRYFTGGNPRLVLMLYRVISQSEVTEVRESLEKLLDEVTPYYKAKIDSLPAQQRKILDHIARVSNQTSEGVTPGEVARATRVTPQTASKQLQRLGEMGYIRAANVRGRNSFYTLSEPLYAIWHQMRFGRGAKRRIQWLVDFLKEWYGDEGLGSESQRLATLFTGLLEHGLDKEARKALEHRRLIAHAIATDEAFEGVISGYLEIQELETIKQEILPEIKLENLSRDMLESLLNANCISDHQFEVAIVNITSEPSEIDNVIALLELSSQCIDKKMWDAAIAHLYNALEKSPRIEINIILWTQVAKAMLLKKDYIEALTAINHGLIEHRKTTEVSGFEGEVVRGALALLYRYMGECFYELKRFDEAIPAFDKSLNIDETQVYIWQLKGMTLQELSNFPESIICFDHAINLIPNTAVLWVLKSISTTRMGDTKAGIILLKKASDIYLEEDSSLENKHRGLRLALFLKLIEENFDGAVDVWKKLDSIELEISTPDGDKWFFLTRIAKQGHAKLVSRFISRINVEEKFLPLHRALAYLSTGDELLIEKLSPEVRNLVLEMVEEFRPQFADEPKPLPKKPKAAPRKRINKQLN